MFDQAIPTIYGEQRFRSRLEADTARYFDEHGIRWVYEAVSFLLPSGLHYWPDFYLPDVHLWVEARGYQSSKGDAQLAQFPLVLPRGDAFLIRRRDRTSDVWQFAPRRGDADGWQVDLHLNYLLFSDAWAIVSAVVAHHANRSAA